MVCYHFVWIVVAMVVAILSLSTGKSAHEESDCLVPKDEHLLSKLMENGGIVLSPPEGTGIEDVSGDLGVYGANQGLDDVTPDDKHCPEGEKPSQDSPLNERATCPWRFVLDHDPTRYPKTVFHAVGRCGSCLGPGGFVLPGTRCEPVTYETVVLRQKGCERPGGVMQYSVEKMEQVVAFQCVVSEETPQD